MICTSVVTCLSSGFVKINKMFVLFSQVFGYFESSAFFPKIGGGGVKLHTKQSNRMFVVNF